MCRALFRWPGQHYTLARLPRAGEAFKKAAVLLPCCEECAKLTGIAQHFPMATLCMLAPEHCHSRKRLTSDSRFMSSPVRVLSKKPVSCPISRLNNVHRRRHMTRSAAELNSLQGSMVSQRWSGRLQTRVLRDCACPPACECHTGLLHEMPQHAGWLVWVAVSGVTLKKLHSPCRRR